MAIRLYFEVDGVKFNGIRLPSCKSSSIVTVRVTEDEWPVSLFPCPNNSTTITLSDKFIVRMETIDDNVLANT